MFITCGYDFCRDANALNPAPTSASSYTTVKLSNGVFDHWNVSRDVTSPLTTEIPTVWDFLTVMDCNFNGNIEAGNLDFTLSTIDSIKIKRKKLDEFQWVTLKEFPVSGESALSFSITDNFAQSGVEYEYAFVPVSAGVEGNYITNSISTKFDGIFICDADTVYRFYSGVTYGAEERVQKIGVFEPYGRQYPVVVSNGVINYSKGSFTGNILPNDYMKNRIFDRKEMTEKKKELLQFLTNKKPKIIKDWNSQCWLVVIVDNPNVNYDAASSMGLMNVSANWVEIGDSNNNKDLYNAGLVAGAE